MNSSNNWRWICNNKQYDSKVLALVESNGTGYPVTFAVPDAYNNYDFSREPTPSWHEMLCSRAKHIRDNCEYLNFWFSGGIDSKCILNAFIMNQIKIDEVTLIKSGFTSADYEIDQALAFLKSQNIKTKINLIEPSKDLYNKAYKDKDWIHTWPNATTYSFRLIDYIECRLLEQTKSGTIHVIGREKPKLCYIDNKWYTYFLDSNMDRKKEQAGNAVFFYSDDPELHCKQSHMLKNYIENNFTKYFYDTPSMLKNIVSQTVTNVGSGRISQESESFIPKQQIDKTLILNGKPYYAHNAKEVEALKTAAQDTDYRQALYNWQAGIEKLVAQLGEEHFNQGRPELGFVGRFSDFYCLSTNETKNIDELFPNGFIG